MLRTWLGVGAWSAAFRRWRCLAIGCLPGLVLVAVLKLWLIPGREPALAQPATVALAKLVQFDRYAMIGKALWEETLRLGPGLGHPLILLAILALTLGVQRPRQWGPAATFAALTVGLTFGAYCGVYLITPQELNWQLGTTVSRLYAQPWPAFLWVAFLLLKRVEDRLRPAESDRKARAGRRKPQARKGKR